MRKRKFKCGHKSKNGIGDLCRDCFNKGLMLESPKGEIGFFKPGTKQKKKSNYYGSGLDEANRVRERNNELKRKRKENENV